MFFKSIFFRFVYRFQRSLRHELQRLAGDRGGQAERTFRLGEDPAQRSQRSTRQDFYGPGRTC